MTGPSRRDFLKFGSVLSGALAASRFLPRSVLTEPAGGASLPNIIILVFDAMSAKNLSLYGYPRKTTPNFERFAARSTVYDQHYSAGNFTTPGTASLLTGLYPWTHRAINGSGLIAASLADHNVFRVLGGQYHRLAFSQNMWPNYFFGQFERDIEQVLSPGSFSLLDQFPSAAFSADLVNSHRAFDQFLLQDGFPPASLVFGLGHELHLYEAVALANRQGKAADLASEASYPIVFRLRDVLDGVLQTISGLPQPFLAYLHIWSPHEPYMPAPEFRNLFNDGWNPEPKPGHPLSKYPHQPGRFTTDRRMYDRYIANVDFEFGRLLDDLQARGILDNSYLIVTSDHGEMFERGQQGHATPLLFEPVVRVPLMISAPGQSTRRDIHVPTSAVDLLPTLAHLTGKAVPAWAEGQVLPGLGGTEDAGRSIFVCEAKNNHPWEAWSQASYVLRKGQYKLTYYTGYEQFRKRKKDYRFELYDIDNDPEELNDLYSPSSPTAQELSRELLERVQAENAEYKKAG